MVLLQHICSTCLERRTQYTHGGHLPGVSVSQPFSKYLNRNLGRWLGTNLIHDLTAVTFSVKFAFFRENPHFREIQ